jgi:chromosome segregation ATPase
MSKARIAVVTALLIGITITVALRAQTPASASNDAVAALVAEIRALRTELSQVASASVRSQLLVTRVQLQEQRLMHLDRQRAEVSAKLGEVEKMRVMFAGQVKQLQTQSTQSGDAKEREAAQFVIEGMKNQLQAAQASEAALRAEQDALLNSMSAEQSRWSDFNGRLDELERALPAAGTGLRAPGTPR